MIDIKEKEKCCGCSACASICPKNCIEMKEDNEGFLYPCVDKKSCVECDLCEKVCPILNYKKTDKNHNQSAFIVQNKDKEVCRQSTAGGAFSAIGEYVIDQGGIVFGVELQDDYFVRHIGVSDKEKLVKFRNSKYVQSYIGNSYKEVKEYLNSGRLVCFSGTPCQIEGLLTYLGGKPENLVLVDVVCRAVPSPGVWRKYINMISEKLGGIKSVRFRDKTLGYQYSTMELRDKNNRIYRGGSESHPWLRMFLSGMIIRPSCTECPFRAPYRKSDFTIWDCFNIHNIDKSFNENTGTTRMLIHTDKGKRIFENIKDNFKYKNIDVEVAIKNVKEMVFSPEFNVKRKEFFKDYENIPMDELINKYFPNTFKVKLKKNARLFLNYIGLDKILKHVLKKG